MSAHPTQGPTDVVAKSKQNLSEKPAPPPTAALPLPQADGRPATVWQLAMSLVGTIPVYGYFFRVWDQSELPETFTNPWFWDGTAIVVAVTCIGGWLVRQRGSSFDKLILSVLAFASLAVIGVSALVSREAVPSDTKYSVAVFDFTGDDDRSLNAAKRLRGSLLRALGNVANHNSAQFELQERAREPKGDAEEEKIEYLTKWARRGKSCHLALWVHVGIENSQYVLTVHHMKVHSLGKEWHDDDLGHFSYWADNITAQPLDDGISIGNVLFSKIQALDRIVSTVHYYWGLAEYRKRDYDSALRILPTGFANSEYYAGLAAYDKALSQVEGSSRLLTEAEQHFQEAIILHTEQDQPQTTFLFALGALHLARVIAQRNDDVKTEAYKATAWFKEAGKVAKQLHLDKMNAQVQVAQAKITYALWTQPHMKYLIKDGIVAMRGTEDLIQAALPFFQPDSIDYWDATEQLARAYLLEAQWEPYSAAPNAFRKALTASERVLTFYERMKDDDGIARAEHVLGLTNAEYGLFLKNRTLFETGVKLLEKTLNTCGPSRRVNQCFWAHWDIASGATKWADLSPEHSSTRIKELGRALEELKLAETFLSPREQPRAYGWIKADKAVVLTHCAMSETQNKQEELLHSVLKELSEGLAVVGADRSIAPQLYEDRAEAYRRLYAYSRTPDPIYKKLAQLDEDAAKRITTQGQLMSREVNANMN